MAKPKAPKKEKVVLSELTPQDIQDILKDVADCKSKKLSGYKVSLIDCKKSNINSKAGSLAYINSVSSPVRVEAYGIVDLGTLQFISAFKPGKRYAQDQVKFSFNLNSVVSITKNEEYEAKRLEAVNEISNRLAGYCKLSAAKIETLINSNATLDYKAGLEAGFFDKNVKPEKNTSAPKSVVSDTGKPGILVGDKSNAPTSETETSKETISATQKAEEVPGLENIEVVEEKPSK